MQANEPSPLSRFPSLSSPEVSGAVWDALVTDPGTGVAVLDIDGRVLFCNEAIAQLLTGGSAAEAVGKTLWDLFPVDYAQERIRYVRHAIEDHQPVLLKSLWKGRRIRSAIHPIPADEQGKPDNVLVVSRAITSDADFKRDDDEFEVIETQVKDFGDLAALTPREIEVLALIGQGLSIKRIAELLNRSPKTIENHRHSLGIKLETTNRVQLARIAYEAGLTTNVAAAEEEEK